MRRWIRRVWVGCGLAFTAWLIWSVQAHGVADTFLVSDPAVTVDTTAHAFVFTPARPSAKPAVIFLPGGGIEPKAYVPLTRGLAGAGHPAALVFLPYRLAPTAATRAELWNRIAALIARWKGRHALVLAGHSRGAALASGFAARHAAELDGLILIGTTHPRDDDLSHLTIPVMKVMGSEDCVAAPDAARANGRLLPAATKWIEIAGANHAQFGYYGSQLMDCSPSITREAQQEQTAAAIRSFLEDRPSR